jgi:hypothetical protein
MQGRYAGDIGDYVKFSLLRAIADPGDLGVIWYLYPDEQHNNDGRHIEYLDQPARWRHLDPSIFDALQRVVRRGARSVRSLERANILPGATYSQGLLAFDGSPVERSNRRRHWFESALAEVSNSRVVFADPDNGLCEDNKYRFSSAADWKRIPVSEALELSEERTGVVYHHNTRRKGGHALEIQYWLGQLGERSVALYWRPYSPRTFFIVNPDSDISRRLRLFVDRWAPHIQLHERDRAIFSASSRRSEIYRKRRPTRNFEAKRCPECGHKFKGTGWGGIDAHWKASHSHIMEYSAAWPIIRKGLRPSDFVQE